ncbi:MAG TPA: tetratricopeptide repeat protein [Kofleriaceae bacterium]|nr:tetratricopeptide repeat protein [Kofleriaceae bacterium]
MKSLALLLVLVAAPAWAQSKRYPPEPVDRDQEKTEHSVLWENAANPSHEPYRALVDQARQAIGERTDRGLHAATEKLDRAIALLPQEGEAYALRGDAAYQLKRWDACAADFGVAVAKAPRREPAEKKALLELRRKHAHCLALSGKLATAERVLAEATAAGTGTGDMLMRLGEVRIALGKLDEAIATLTAALDAPETPQAMTRWLLALAYDRARRPAEAIEAVRRAMTIDRSFSVVSSQLLIGPGDAEYIKGLAYASMEGPKPELATIYFRQYLKLSTNPSWRKRAEEHLRELKDAQLPESIDRLDGTAALDLEAARLAVKKGMPALRACMAKTPSSVVQVRIVRVGPRTKAEPYAPPNPYRRYSYRRPPPPAGASVAAFGDVPLEATRAEIDAALRCIEPLASRLALPAVKEKDAWYEIAFFVIGP